MNTQKGFTLAATLLVVLGIAVLGGVGYVAMNPEVLKNSATEETIQQNTGVSANTSIQWSFTSAGEVDAMPYTNVAVTVDGKTYDMGKFVGSCAEIGASGGIDGKGLLAGELSAAQCYFAGGGQEIGVFAHEDGGYQIMVGQLDEGSAEIPAFRGDFEIKVDIQP